ncbi:MAG: hypothetical protein FWC50_10280 [Planctomycetaceae bacterium]|nr:hypothetical protein [Planctomycetaceae bacterium]
MRNDQVFRMFFVSTLSLTTILLGIEAGYSRAEETEGRMTTKWGQSLNPDMVHVEYPRPQLRRSEWLNLNGYWDLSLSENDVTMGKPSKTIPILVPFPIESQLSGVAIHSPAVIYRKSFRIPPAWAKTDRVILHFGAVDWEAVVHVNGKLVGTHHGGYDSFSYDITEALLADADQMLTVTVHDPTEDGSQPCGNQSRRPERGRHTSVTGIWQTVWLEPVPPVSVKQLQMTTDFDAKSISLKVIVENAGDDLVVQAELYDGDNFVVRAFGGANGTLILRIPESGFKPWSPESPNLYQLRVAILDNNKIVDQVGSYAGIRKIEVVQMTNGRNMIFLNGSPYFQKGVVDHGVWPDGLYTAPSEAATRSDLQVAKSFGFNMIRKSEKIEPERWYYLCDTFGMLVWQEFPAARRINTINADATNAESFNTELTAMPGQLQNHPSIVAWLVSLPKGADETQTQLSAEKIHEKDPTRLFSVVSENVAFGNIGDVNMLSGLRQPIQQPQTVQTIGKFGGIDLYAKDHSWQREHWGFREVATTEQLLKEIGNLVDVIAQNVAQHDVSAIVYHQLTDMETETDGLMTYDRKLIKVPDDAIRAFLEKLKL